MRVSCCRAGGPKILWRKPVGGGFAGPAVAGGKVYVLDRLLAPGAENPKNPFAKDTNIPGSERVICFDGCSRASSNIPAAR